MNAYLYLRRSAKNFLIQPQVNSVVRCVLSNPIAGGLLPANQVERVPVVGKVSVELPSGQRFIMQTDGDDAIASKMFWQRRFISYEPDTTQLFLALLRGSRTFFDVGANTGLYALAAAAEDPLRNVYAFEPFPAIYTYLTRNTQVNGFKNLRTFAVAVTDFVGTTPFYIPTASAVFPFSASTAAGLSPALQEIHVPATTLDQFVREQRVECVDLMKVDTETTEPQVLAGAAETLRAYRPIMICEVLPYGKEPLLHAVLDPLDYNYFWIQGQTLVAKPTIVADPTLANMNYLFVPKERVGELAARNLVGMP